MNDLLKPILNFLIMPSAVPHYILFILLLLIISAGVLFYLFFIKYRNNIKEIKEQTIKFENEVKNLKEELDFYKQEKNRLLSELDKDRQVDTSSKEISESEYDEIFIQNKELIFLSKDFLVNDFIDIIKNYFPQDFNLKRSKVKISLKIQKRIEDILQQLQKIEELSKHYNYKFSIDYYYQKIYYYLGQHLFYNAIQELYKAIEIFDREDNFYIYLAQLLFVVSNYDKSVEILNKFLDYKVSNVFAYELLVYNFIKLKKYKEAEYSCNLLIELKQNKYEGLLAYILLLEGFVSKAENKYEDIIKKNLFSPITYYYLGKIDEEKGDLKEALQKFLKSYNSGERNYELLKDIIVFNNLFSHFSISKKIIDEIQYMPDIDSDIIYIYAKNARKKYKDLLFFVDILKTLNEQRKIDYKVLNNLGQFCLMMHKEDEAIEYFKKSIEIREDFLPALINIIKYYLNKKMFSKAKEYIDKGFSFYPNESELSLLLSEYYYMQKDFTSAKKVLNDVLEREPSNILLYNKIGLIYLKEKDYKEALVYFSKLEGFGIKNVELYRNFAFAYFKLKNYSDAIYYYNKVLQLDPNNIDAYNNLGVIYSLKKEFKKAKRHLNKALQIDPDSKETNYNLALLYQKINQENSVKYYAKYKDLTKEEEEKGE